MEDAEARDTQNDEANQCVQHLQRVLEEHRGTVEDPIRHEATTYNNEAVNQQNAPIRQRVLRKIPV